MGKKRKKKAVEEREGAQVASGHEIGVDPERLWAAADKLRGTVDAAEYKHVVLGLVFLKYISDAFEGRRAALKAELAADGIEGKQAEQLLESRDEYTAENVFWVPPEARWGNLQNQAKRAEIAKLIDDAMYAIERDNEKLKGKLPRDYARRGIPVERLGGLIDQIASIAIGTDEARAKDVLGRGSRQDRSRCGTGPRNKKPASERTRVSLLQL